MSYSWVIRYRFDLPLVNLTYQQRVRLRAELTQLNRAEQSLIQEHSNKKAIFSTMVHNTDPCNCLSKKASKFPPQFLKGLT
jgi:hypothetical protein